jgi:hypothetical protein
MGADASILAGRRWNGTFAKPQTSPSGSFVGKLTPARLFDKWKQWDVGRVNIQIFGWSLVWRWTGFGG